MKFCVQCGAQIPDNARFCTSCGATAVTPAPGAATPHHGGASHVSRPPSPTYTPGYRSPAPSAMVNPVGTYFRQAAVSPLFIIFAIVFSIYLLMNLSLAIDPASMFEGELFGETLDLLSDVEIIESIEDFMTTILFVGQVPNMLIVVGIWVTFFSAVGSSQLRNGKGIGLIAGLYKALRIIYPILLALVSFSILSACSAINNEAKSYLYDRTVNQAANDAKAILAGVFIGMWVAGGFIIFYFSKIIETLESLSYSISHGTASADISMFVVVMGFISGGSSVISAVSFEGILFWINLMNAVSLILASCILLTVRGKLLHLSYLRRTASGSSLTGARRWECKNCYSSNPPGAVTCVKCGARKDAAPFGAHTSGSSTWKCVCGRVNASYVTTCGCGRGKYH